MENYETVKANVVCVSDASHVGYEGNHKNFKT